MAEFAGTVDVMLLPRSGPAKLVLVEAKVATARDAASKVIGQVLMYYAGALQLGSEGLRLMRRFARDHPESAHAWGVKSPKRISGGVSPPPAAWRRIYEGTKLTPDQIRIFIAIDAEPHRALRPTLLALRRHHGVRIGLIRVTGGRVRELSLRRGDVHAP